MHHINKKDMQQWKIKKNPQTFFALKTCIFSQYSSFYSIVTGCSDFLHILGFSIILLMIWLAFAFFV